MNTDDDGFQSVSHRFTFNNTFATIEHPTLHRMSYTIFKFEDPINRGAQLYHTRQILLFCSTSSRIIDNKFNVFTMPPDYLTFAHAFNSTARLTHKRFTIYDPQTGVPIVPSDPICITDFLLDQDLIRSLRRTYPESGFEFQGNDPQWRKEVAFRGPLQSRICKHADTLYPRSAFCKQLRPYAGGSNIPANN